VLWYVQNIHVYAMKHLLHHSSELITDKTI